MRLGLHSLLALAAAAAITAAATSASARVPEAEKQCPAVANWQAWNRQSPPLTGVDVNYVRLSDDGRIYWNNILIGLGTSAENKLGYLLQMVFSIRNAQVVFDRGAADCNSFQRLTELVRFTPLCAAGRCWFGNSPETITLPMPVPKPAAKNR